jgi:hypothetical protein
VKLSHLKYHLYARRSMRMSLPTSRKMSDRDGDEKEGKARVVMMLTLEKRFAGCQRWR